MPDELRGHGRRGSRVGQITVSPFPPKPVFCTPESLISRRRSPTFAALVFRSPGPGCIGEFGANFVNNGDAEPTPDRALETRLGLGRTRRRWRGWVWIGGVLAILASGTGWYALHRGPAHSYVTKPVTRGTLAVNVSATGTLAPRTQVDVGVEVSGRIDKLFVDFNDRVKKGEVLALINTDQYVAQLQQAQASLAQAQATLKQSTLTHDRYAALEKANAVSRELLNTSTGDLARAAAGVDLARAQVQQDQTLLSYCTIYSPIDGVVLDRKVSAGQTVAASFSTPVLFTLASDLTQMELDVDIDEADVGLIRSGARATFTVDAYPTRVFSARLISIHNAPKTVQGVVTYQGVLRERNEGGLLRPGMTATAEIEAATITNAAARSECGAALRAPGRRQEKRCRRRRRR